MKTLFVGDVHGCAAALDGLLRLAQADRVILLGDLFTKGPDPAGVWRIVEDKHPESIFGNHDAKLLRDWDVPGTSAGLTADLLPHATRSWLESLPSQLHGQHRGRSWVAIHGGVHPEFGAAGTDRRLGYLIRRWPDDLDLTNPFWWQRYHGPERVFYGHDAMRGLQVHPDSVGLDTGCCYGQALTGWILEEERALQVRPDGTPVATPERYWSDFP